MVGSTIRCKLPFLGCNPSLTSAVTPFRSMNGVAFTKTICGELLNLPRTSAKSGSQGSTLTSAEATGANERTVKSPLNGCWSKKQRRVSRSKGESKSCSGKMRAEPAVEGLPQFAKTDANAYLHQSLHAYGGCWSFSRSRDRICTARAALPPYGTYTDNSSRVPYSSKRYRRKVEAQ